jgi:hypothetical protein
MLKRLQKMGVQETKWQRMERKRCHDDVAYFIDQYCLIYNATERDWVHFQLWEAQRDVLDLMVDEMLVIVLKARQLGLSWLVVCYMLWMMIFHPSVTVLMFSKRDDEASKLLDERMKGVYHRLPSWLHGEYETVDNAHNWHLSNGSNATALPTTGGRSYTASIVMVDEADFVPDLDALLNAVKPTIDAGGQLILISSSDKSKPSSAFKNIYRAAKKHLTKWVHVFLPWWSRPSRTQEWYDEQHADIQQRTGSLDDLWAEYPATDVEALAARTLDKRLSPMWLQKCWREMDPIQPDDMPALVGLQVFESPVPGHRYVIGADTAEGNPNSDDSALTIMNVETGNEAATMAGKFEATTLAAHADLIGRWYNNAALMPERNNHGHTFIAWIKDNSKLRLLPGHDDKPGWLSSSLGKTRLYDAAADAFREGDTTLHSFVTYEQLASIEGSTLLAPEGMNDDRADAYALAIVGRLAAYTERSQKRQAKVKGRGVSSHNRIGRRVR